MPLGAPSPDLGGVFFYPFFLSGQATADWRITLCVVACQDLVFQVVPLHNYLIVASCPSLFIRLNIHSFLFW